MLAFFVYFWRFLSNPFQSVRIFPQNFYIPNKCSIFAVENNDCLTFNYDDLLNYLHENKVI